MKLWMVCGWPETTMKRHSSVALVFSSISGGCSKSSCNRFFAKSSSSKKLGSPQEPQKRHMLEPLRTGSNFQDPPGQRAREEPWSLILFWRGLTKLVSSRYKFHTIFQSKNVTFGVRWTRLLCESLQVKRKKRVATMLLSTARVCTSLLSFPFPAGSIMFPSRHTWHLWELVRQMLKISWRISW